MDKKSDVLRYLLSITDVDRLIVHMFDGNSDNEDRFTNISNSPQLFEYNKKCHQYHQEYIKFIF